MELFQFNNKSQKQWMFSEINLCVENFKILKSNGEPHCYILNGNDPVAKIGIFCCKKDSVKRFFGFVLAESYRNNEDILISIEEIVKQLWRDLQKKEDLPFMNCHKWERIPNGTVITKNGIIIKKQNKNIAILNGTTININSHTIITVGGKQVIQKFKQFLRW